MTLPTRSLWPDHVRAPFLRLGIGVIAAPVILAALGTLIAFVIAGASESTRAGTMAVTWESGLAIAVLAVELTVIAGLPGIATLWWMGRRGIFAWSLAGAIFGAAATVLLALLQAGMVAPAMLVVGVVLSVLLFLLIRGIAGVRSR